jgi:hypothetical protein
MRSIMTSLRSLRIIPLGVALGACYSYAPVERPATIPQGTSIRARVTPTASQRISPLLGVEQARIVDGPLVARTGDAMVVEVATTTPVGLGTAVQTLHQRVALAPSDVTEVETRTLDRARTAMVVGALAAGAIALAANYLRSDPGVDRPPTGSPPENRIPLLRFRF